MLYNAPMSVVRPYLKIPLLVDGYSYTVDTWNLPTTDKEIIPLLAPNNQDQILLLNPHRLIDLQAALERASYYGNPPTIAQKGSAYVRVALSISFIAAALLCSMALLPPYLAVSGVITSLGLYTLLSLYNQRMAGSQSPLNLRTLVKGPYYPILELERGNNPRRDLAISQFNTAFNAAVTFFKEHQTSSLKELANSKINDSTIKSLQLVIPYIDQCIAKKEYSLGQSNAIFRESEHSPPKNVWTSYEGELTREIVEKFNEEKKRYESTKSDAIFRESDKITAKAFLKHSAENRFTLADLHYLKGRFTKELGELGGVINTSPPLADLNTLKTSIRDFSSESSLWQGFIEKVDEIAQFYLEGYKKHPY